MDRDALCKKWEKAARELLVGKTIESVEYMCKDELEAEEWEGSPLVLCLKGADKKLTYLYAVKDEDSHEPAELFVEHPNGIAHLPVI